MECKIGESGELTKTFDVANPQACRLAAAVEVAVDGKPAVNFTTTEGATMIPGGTGTAVAGERAADGRPCATVTLANGKSGNICVSPSR